MARVPATHKIFGAKFTPADCYKAFDMAESLGRCIWTLESYTPDGEGLQEDVKLWSSLLEELGVYRMRIRCLSMLAVSKSRFAVIELGRSAPESRPSAPNQNVCARKLSFYTTSKYHKVLRLQNMCRDVLCVSARACGHCGARHRPRVQCTQQQSVDESQIVQLARRVPLLIGMFRRNVC
jgi:hypothetical protein